MKKQEWNEGLNNIDPDILERYLKQKKELKAKKPKLSFIKYVAVAACMCLVVCGIIFLPMMFKGEGDEPIGDNLGVGDGEGESNTGSGIPIEHDPIIFDAWIYPDKLSGSSMEYVYSSSSGGSNVQGAPPAFDFDIGGFNVKARVVNNLPDTYYKLDVSSSYKPMAYRLIQMETLEVLIGVDVPKYFYYLIPEYTYVDMSVYDSLIISMRQVGTENYVLKNGTQNQIESFKLPVFGDVEDNPELGNIIAFSDGVFDESLWQNENWIYGYQFGSDYLENPQYSDLVVYRGCTEDEAIAEINSRLDEKKDRYNNTYGKDYCGNTLKTLSFTTPEAKDAVEYVEPFKNGVFCQSFINNTIIFRRFINGCQTEETVTIDFETEEVTYSSVRYDKSDMENLDNIASHLSALAEQYKNEFPTPPHIDTEGKNLRSLHLYAWYVKVDGKLYGVVKTVWRYLEHVESSEYGWGYYVEYYDEAYILYDMSDFSAKNISREDLIDIVGNRNISNKDFGVGDELPL